MALLVALLVAAACPSILLAAAAGLPSRLAAQHDRGVDQVQDLIEFDSPFLLRQIERLKHRRGPQLFLLVAALLSVALLVTALLIAALPSSLPSSLTTLPAALTTLAATLVPLAIVLTAALSRLRRCLRATLALITTLATARLLSLSRAARAKAAGSKAT